MAGVNQISSLADDVARYLNLKACGKSSVLLQTKPVNPSQLKGLKLANTLNTDVVEFSTKKIYEIIPMHRNYSIGSNTKDIRNFLYNPDKYIKRYGEHEAVEKIYFINLIDEQFRMLKPLERPTVAYRGINNQGSLITNFDNMYGNLTKLKEGDIFILDDAYSFYGTEPACLEMFGNNFRSLRDGAKVIRITANFPQGSIVSRGISTNAEYGLELVTPRAAKCKLISKKANEYNGYDIVIDYTKGDLPPKLKVPPELKEVEAEMLTDGDLDCYLKKV